MSGWYKKVFLAVRKPQCDLGLLFWIRDASGNRQLSPTGPELASRIDSH